MKKIINANELRRIGGFDRFVLEEEMQIPLCELEAAGDFSYDCMQNMIQYLSEKNLQLESFAFSADLQVLLFIKNYSPARKVIIPEGIKSVPSNCFVNCNIQELYLPSTLQIIESDSFTNAQIDKLVINKDNKFLSVEDGILFDSFTKEIFCKESERSFAQVFTENQKNLWSKIKCVGNFRIETALFWKQNFLQQKTKLKPQNIIVPGNINPYRLLKLYLQSLPDFYANWKIASKKDFCSYKIQFGENLVDKYVSYMQGYTKQTNAFISGSWESFQNPQNRNKLFVYNSHLLHPEIEEIAFSFESNGMNMFAPGIQLYLFYTIEEMNLIVPYIEYLHKNFLNLMKEYNLQNIFENDNPPSEIEIKSNDRNKILDMLK